MNKALAGDGQAPARLSEQTVDSSEGFKFTVTADGLRSHNDAVIPWSSILEAHRQVCPGFRHEFDEIYDKGNEPGCVFNETDRLKLVIMHEECRGRDASALRLRNPSCARRKRRRFKRPFSRLDYKNHMQTAPTPKCGDYFDPKKGDDLPPDLFGATIVRIGSPVSERVIEGGGLAIEYTPNGSNERKLLVLEFNELGMWVSKKS